MIDRWKAALGIVVVLGVSAISCSPQPAERSRSPEMTAPPSSLVEPPSTAVPVPFAGPGSVGPYANVPRVHSRARLATHRGDLETSRNGQVISGLRVTGVIVVRNRNVVIRDVIAEGVALDVIESPTASVSIEWSRIGAVRGRADSYNAVGTGNFRIYRSDVFGSVDLLKLVGGYAIVEQSWIHDGFQWRSDPLQGGEAAHVDLFQTALRADARVVRILDSRFDAWVFRSPQRAGKAVRNLKASRTATGAVSLFQHRNEHHIEDVLVDGNRFDGDVYEYFYVTYDRGDRPPSNVRFVDNVITRRYPDFGRQGLMVWDGPPADVGWSGNVDQRGRPIPRPAPRTP